MNRRLLMFTFTALAVLMILASLLVLTKQDVGIIKEAQAASTFVPFTVTQREILKCAGDSIPATYIEARASDGSRSRIHQNSKGPVEKWVRGADGTIMRAYEHVGAKSTMRVSPERALGSQLNPAAACMQPTEGGILHDTRSAGNEPVLGYETVKLVTTATGIRITAWHALRLGCIPLRQTYEQKQKDGTWKLISMRETTQIQEGEPLDYLFTSAAAEMKPSAAAEALVRYGIGGLNLSQEEIETKLRTARQRRANQDANYAKFHVD